MKNYKLLTVSDLAERWKKTELTIRRYVLDGIITPCEGVPGVMFSPEYIAKLEGVELRKISTFEFKKLEYERDLYKKENEKLKNIITNILAESSKIFELNKEDK
ncbi:hypothetical protein [Clostridium baratii]|uniref:hypothetical protein n=1 Tax=Clostridium baratii TaxID=1561 RepID=UPI0006BA89CD|nr:hypothetical protein [Clostridium baratii]